MIHISCHGYTPGIIKQLEGRLNVLHQVRYDMIGWFLLTFWLAVVKGAVYQLLGTFCETFPEHMMEYSSRIITMYIKALKEQVHFI